MCRLGCYRRNAKAGTSSARPLSADRFSAAAFSKEIGHFIDRQTQNFLWLARRARSALRRFSVLRLRRAQVRRQSLHFPRITIIL